MEKQKKCHFEIHNNEWYRDAKGRVWVVVGFWYEKMVKDRVYLLQMGHTQIIEQPYKVVQGEIEAKRMIIIPPQ